MSIRLVFAPSGKRTVPYPPVGIAVLAAKLHELDQSVETCDLEIAVACERLAGRPPLVCTTTVRAEHVLADSLAPDVAAYGDLIWKLSGAKNGEVLGISVMGHEQLASALLLARTALSRGGRVVAGGQFWTTSSAAEALTILGAPGRVAVTVGDGWEAIAALAAGWGMTGLPNTFTHDGERVVAGPSVTSKSLPPQPDYSWVRWDQYEQFGRHAYKNDALVRRAHLYVWDKLCNFRCAFCRVASGSRAVLSPPGVAIDSFRQLVVDWGVGQLNFMTNELNPSRKYMLRFLDEMERQDITGADWFTYVRADRLEQEDFARLRRAGGRLARYGVESGSQQLLDLMRKDYDVPTMSRTLQAAHREEIWNHVNLLIGFPGEAESDIDATVDFLAANADAIHSVRINPFYLPPDTPMARAPHEFGITLTEFDQGWWQFENSDGTPADPDVVVERVERVSRVCVDLGIGFAGTDPFFLLDVINRYAERLQAVNFLRDDYPLFWVPAPTDAYKAMIGGYTSTSGWKDISLKRQSNYSLSICTD